MYQPQELFGTLSASLIAQILHLGGIPEKDSYTEDEADRFHKCHEFILAGLSDDEIINLLPITPSSDSQDAPGQTLLGDNAVTEAPKTHSSSTKKSKKPSKPNPKDITELLKEATSLVGAPISLTEALSILQACGLTDKEEEYTQSECASFLSACKLLKQEGKSFSEVADHFGLTTLNNNTKEDTNPLLVQLQEVSAILGDEQRELIKEVVRQKAKGDISELPKVYLQALVEEMREPYFAAQWQQLREAFKASVMGKKPASQIFPAQQPLANLPPTLENGSKSE